MKKQVNIILVSCLYMSGIIAYFSSFTLAYFLIISGILFILLTKNILNKQLYIILTLVLFFGIINSSCHMYLQDDLTSYANENANIKAKVISIPTNNIDTRTKFYAKVYKVNNKSVNAKSLITINDKKENYKKIKIGDTINLKGDIRIPQYAKNPSQFDFSKYLQYRKTFSLIYVKENWQITGHANDFLGKFLRKLNDTRTNIINIHAQNIKSPMLEILGGIIFGDDAVNPDEDTKNSFINSGIFHILAASGMNVTLIFGIWFFFAKNLRFNYKFSIITGILLILFYTCMTGFGPPIIRAFLMLTLILIGKLINRSTSTISLIFLVAFLMLIYNPLMLLDIGFQLSFLVTFALILSAPLITFNFNFKPLNYIFGACLIPLIAQIYAAPLQMYYFNTFTIYSVFANIAIVPVLSIVSFIGFISSIIALINPISDKICFIADFILNPLLIYIVKIAQFFSKLPHSIITTSKPMLIQIFLYFAIIISITCVLRYKLYYKKILCLICTICIMFLITFIKIENNNPEIIFFSVENADAILLKAPNKDYFLIDTGKAPYLNSSTQAKNIIIKYLKDRGINKLEALILTHFDADHAGGSIDILENLKINNIYITDVYENTILSENIIKYIKDKNLNSKVIKEETPIYNKDNFKLNLIKPKGGQIKTENQKSLLTHLNYGAQNILFMGDADNQSYMILPDKYKKDLSIIKLGHHGAKGTVNNEMTKNADLFVISTGKNVYNHPNPETINILEENNKKYLRTDYHNAIKVILNEKQYKISVFSPKKKKFVNIY